MKKRLQKILKYKYRWHALAALLLVLGAGAYLLLRKAPDDAASFYVVDAVEWGTVTSGIQTTGDIIAEQKLDIDVYKQLSRIDAVSVANGSHVKAGQVLVSFDKSDAYVDTQSSRVAVAEAELALEAQRENAGDPSTKIRTAENQVAGYEKAIADAKQDIEDAYPDFLNENLELRPRTSAAAQVSDASQPQLSGRYASGVEGEYVVDIYPSGAASGYSYTVSGLERMTGSVVFGRALDLGTRGLKITFPSGMRSSYSWSVAIPNAGVASYADSRRAYEQRISDLEKTLRDAEVNLANAKQDLENLKREDSGAYRDLGVEKAQASLAEARQRLSKNYDVVQERDIVAPFAGTVEGMENVVVGATPVGGTSDTINLGTLISDEFLTTFSLGAADVAKVSVGQKVKVTVTSFPQQPVFEASITQISSLPSSDGVAQYQVQARLDYDRTTAELVLREGMLADIEVVEEEKADALRIPTSAVKYVQGVPKVTVVDRLTEQEQEQADRMGIVRTEGTGVSTYDIEVKLGITGQYYVEVLEGLSEGDTIVVSSLAEAGDGAQEATVRGFAPAGGVMRQATGGQGQRGQGSGQGGGRPAN